MREALVKKRYGIPATLLILLLTAITAGATGASVILGTAPTVKYPTHGSLDVDLGYVTAGTTVSEETENAFFGLPAAHYDLTWTLGGDLDKFSSVSVDVLVDLDDSGRYDPQAETLGTLTKGDTSLLVKDVGGTLLMTNAKYIITVTTAVDERVGTSIVSEPATLNIGWEASEA